MQEFFTLLLFAAFLYIDFVVFRFFQKRKGLIQLIWAKIKPNNKARIISDMHP